MNVLAAIFVAGVGLYTIYCGPRSWPHWLAGCAALGFVVVDRLFPIDGYSRGIGFTVVAALCISADSFLVTGTVQQLRWIALIIALGCLILELTHVVAFLYPLLNCLPLWGGLLLAFSPSKYQLQTANRLWRLGLVPIVAGFMLAAVFFMDYVFLEANSYLNWHGFTVPDPASVEHPWLAPLLVAVGIVATCFAVVRLIPRQLDPILETAESSDQTNSL